MPPSMAIRRRCVWLVAAFALAALTVSADAQQEPIPQVENIPAAGAQLASSASSAPSTSTIAGARVQPAASTAGSSAVSAELPARTPIQLQLETHLSTRFSAYGDGFAARVARPVYYQGREILPTGSIIEGHVVQVRDRRPASGDSELLLKPDRLTMPNGQNYTISAHLIQGDPHNAAKVGSEGVLKEPRGVMTSDLHHGEIAAGSGLAGGALLAGAQGALIGTGVGVAVVAGVWLIHKRHLELNPGSYLTVQLDRPLELRPQPASH